MAGFQSPLHQQQPFNSSNWFNGSGSNNFSVDNFGSRFSQGSNPFAMTTAAPRSGFMDSIGDWFGGSTGEGGMFGGKSMFGGEGSTGWVSPVLQGVGGIMGGWNSMQQLDLAKDQFAFTKEAYQTNLANQTQLTNQQLLDRQTRRNIERPDMFGKADEQWKKENLLPSNK